MENRTTSAEPQHSYFHSPAHSWANPSATAATTSTTTTIAAVPVTISDSEPQSQGSAPPPTSTPATPAVRGLSSTTPQYPQQHLDGSLDAAAAPALGANLPSQFDFLPLWLPHQSNVYYAQLLHYNKLISPNRGGGLQAPPLPPVVSSSNAQAGPRSRSSSKVSLKDSSVGKGTATGGNGSRSQHSSDKNRSGIAQEASPAKMPPKQVQSSSLSGDLSRKHPNRSTPPSASHLSHGPTHASSVPSTPQQRARQFSFESRDPSPNAANNNPSPRSAYSETNSTLPSLRPLPPPRQGGCKYETSQINSRRRIPYSIGNEPLEKMPLDKIKGKLTPEEEKKVAADMNEVFQRLLPSEKVEEKRRKLVQKLEKIFNDEWPGHDIKAHLFGSSGNLLCSDDSDVDICITTTWHELEGVCMIADLLARRGMEKVVCISAAKVPIVKIWDPELGLACDMNVNNTLALENTRMIRIYVEADPRVRQLAMIIKHWTRRRVVNDAAFGGTLSSYTWICLIVAFLQLRTPSVLPTLHQLPYKMPKKDGKPSEFADNLKRLRGLGEKNKSSVADLLFQFFRFYAHEFDYSQYVLSIRMGKLLSKQDKKWYYAINNQLCVEEPFNTSRNLGNTVDEYSFRGLHLELRRAFDLISDAKLEEACEQYVFPKEEERVWSRPQPQPRPVLLRSSSQTHTTATRGGRGGHRNGRHNNNNNNYRGGGSSNRRASSSVPTYDPNMFAPAVNMQQDMWYQNPQLQYQYAQELMAQMAYQENMRQFQMYTQSPLFTQAAQNMAQPMMSSNSNSGQAPGTDQSRASSTDTAAMNASLRPDLFAVYGMTLGQPLFAQAPAGTVYGTYPSTPATPSGHSQEFRRPLQRSTVTTDKGAPASSSSLRSQSQPAARSQPVAYSAVNGQTPLPASQSTTSVTNLAPRNANGIPIPSFMPDEIDFDETPKARLTPPNSEAEKFPGYFATESPSAANKSRQQPQTSANGIAFGDIASQTPASGQNRRRLSTDQLPQSVLDRRMRRTSRSPSPSQLGHARAFSSGANHTTPASAATTSAQQNKDPSRPLVVNGSGLKASSILSPRQPAMAESQSGGETVTSSFDNPLQINSGHQQTAYAGLGLSESTGSDPAISSTISSLTDHSPITANGANAHGAVSSAEDISFRERIALMSAQHMNTLPATQGMYSMGGVMSPAHNQRVFSRQPQDAAIAPLDLAVSEERVKKSNGPETPLLSPVYEASASSPTSTRKSGVTVEEPNGQGNGRKPTWAGVSQQTVKTDEANQGSQDPLKQTKSLKAPPQTQKPNAPRENGHVRGARSESDGGWQKAGKGKKKALTVTQQGQAEPPPKYSSERKGG